MSGRCSGSISKSHVVQQHTFSYMQESMQLLSPCAQLTAHCCLALQIVTETVPALQKLRDQGLVKFIGITGLPLDIYTYVLDR